MDVPVDPQLAAVRLPFSLSQQEVWLDQRAWPGSTHLNIGGAGFIDGVLDFELFHQALQQLVRENEALRLVPLPEGGQFLLSDYDAPLLQVDMPASEDPLESMRQWWQAWMHEPFALGSEPPWRFALLHSSDTLHGLCIQFHHLIMDGWGTSRVMQRWAAIYNALLVRSEVKSADDPGYRQFVSDSLAYRASVAFEQDAAFWRAQFSELPAPLIERRYRDNADAALPPAHVVHHPLPRVDYDRLGKQANDMGGTLFALLIAAIAAYFARSCSRSEVVIGLPSLNRNGRRYRETLGMFVCVFPLSVKIMPGMTGRELLASVSQALKSAMRHQRYPLSETARFLGTIRQRRDSIFDVLFSFERQDYDLHFGSARSFSSRQSFSGLARYPLGITLCEFQAGQDAELTLEASPACFEAMESTWLAARLAWFAKRLAEAPDLPLEVHSLLPPEESRVLLPPAVQQVPPEPYIRQFEQWVARTPRATALVWEEGFLDYARLNAWSEELAVQLKNRGVECGSLVALVMGRSPEQVAAQLAISMAGGAFLPLDPDAPLERLRDIIVESNTFLTMVQEALVPRLAGLELPLLAVAAYPLVGDSVVIGVSVAATDPAYVLYTSGSTGQPKGVVVSHEALAWRLSWLSRTYGVLPEDRTGHCTQYTFDPSLIELLLPLVSGASIALPATGRLSPKALGAFVVRQAVTILALVPSTLRGLLDSIPEGALLKLRVACCGGEVLPAELANRFIQETGARLFNVYGPTEAAIFATAWEVSLQQHDCRLPVGQPVDGTRLYILDEQARPMPFGVIGEICIGGRSVACGYLNRPERDMASFLPDPAVIGGRIYQTGDQGWLSTDGTLHFAGRRDRQIKLRGYRIEPGEVEAALLACEGVEQAAVRVVQDHDRDVLHAWIAGPRLAAEVGVIRHQLESRLPDYMLPRFISCLPVLPVSSTGKIDYAVLPEIGELLVGETGRPPESALERALLALWQAVLKRDDLTVVDNFFDIGGDSLAAIDILAGIETLVGHPVPLFLLIENPCIGQLAAALENSALRSDGSAVMLRLRPGKVPLYFAASGHGDLVRFRNLARTLGDACAFYMLQPPIGESIPSIRGLAECYARQIRANGHGGIIAGFSVGGISALETAQILKHEGFPVERLILVDAIFPGRLMRSAIFWRSMGWLAKHLSAYELSLNGRHLGALFNDAGLVTQIEAMASYHPCRFEGPATLIKSSGLQRWQRWAFEPWRRLLGPSLAEAEVRGMHGSIFEAANVDCLARVLRIAINGRDT